MSIKLKNFLYRYSSFTLAKVALLFGRSAILVLSYKWLSTSEFGLVAGTLSVVEILRAFSDLGAESIIYSRLSGANLSLPHIVKRMIQLRFSVSIIVVVLLLIISPMLNKGGLWPLFLLPLVGSIQNASFAFLQKDRRFHQIFCLVVFVSLIALCTVIFTLLYKPNGLPLLYLMLLPEAATAFLGILLSLYYWKEVIVFGRAGRKFITRLSPYILPNIVVSVLVMLYSRLDMVLVSPFFGEASQVKYSLSIRIVEPIFMILSLGSLAFLAELGTYNSQSARDFIKRLLKFFNAKFYFYILIFSILLGLLVKVISQTFLVIDEDTSLIVFLYASVIPIKLCNSLLSSSLQRFGYFHIVMRAAISVFFITYLLGVFLGFRLGLLGVVCAVIFSEFLNFMYQRKRLNSLLKG
jgi:O-antigen/teichoic acid export membrane protein